MKEIALLRALRASLVAALALLDARLEALLGQPPVQAGPQCPRCHKTRHVTEVDDGLLCGECDHYWEPAADDGGEGPGQ